MTDLTVGEVREALADLLQIPKDDVGHYVMAIDSPAGLIVKFCCDDRQMIAWQFRQAADLILSDPGHSLNDRPPPPMPTS